MNQVLRLTIYIDNFYFTNMTIQQLIIQDILEVNGINLF